MLLNQRDARLLMTGKTIARMCLFFCIVLGLVTFGVASSGFGTPARKPDSDKQKEKKATESHPAVDPSQYVGADTRKTCHEDVAVGYDKSPHWKTTLARHNGPEWQGCEACHGPGKEHAESGDPAKIIRLNAIGREESSKRCLGCHEFGQEHANFLRSEHLKNNVGCVDCHSIHAPKVQAKLLRATQPQLCYSCHLDVKPDFSKPFHHKVNEGL